MRRSPAPTVLFDARRATWYPEVGLSRYARSLLNELLAVPQLGLAIAPIDLSDSTNWKSADVRRLPLGAGWAARFAQEQLCIPILTLRADLIHLPWTEGPLVCRCPVVVTIHDLDMVLNPENYPRRFRIYYIALLRRYLRSAARIIVPSLATLRALEELSPSGQLVHVPHGVDAIFSPHAPIPPRASSPYVLYTGGWGRRKQIRELLAAFSVLADDDPALRLVMTGVPDPSDRAAIASSRYPNKIELPGRVTDEQLAELYRGATLAVYPSLLEGFGFPVVEAFASGTPVVATRSSAVEEIAADAALLVEPDQLVDGMRAALASDALREKLRSRGLQRARDFSWAKAAAQTADVYRELICD